MFSHATTYLCTFITKRTFAIAYLHTALNYLQTQFDSHLNLFLQVPIALCLCIEYKSLSFL